MRLDYKLLKDVCLTKDIGSFSYFGKAIDTPDGILIHQNNNSKVLGVAHLDTVLSLNHFHHIKINGDTLVFNAQLDDRLGVYTLLYLLPQMGITFDLLLTEGEESGCSTAQHFTPEHDYNWMFSFDRRGDDVVMYQYDDDPTRKLLKSAGLKPSVGSFSDIAFMDDLKIKGFNVGTGYYGEHTDLSYASINTLASQINKFSKFYRLYKDTKLPHKSKPNKYSYFSRAKYQDYMDDLYCVLCNRHVGKHIWKDNLYLCDECFSSVGECVVCHALYYEEELMDGVCPECMDFPE